MGPDYQSRFAAQSSPFHRDSRSQLQMDLADAASEALGSKVADYVYSACKAREVTTPGDTATKAILANFMLGVPAQNTLGVGPILNAGWAAFKNTDFMKGYTDDSRKSAVNELVLKSIEVFEIERITSSGT